VRRFLFLVALSAVGCLLLIPAGLAKDKPLQIYFIDVEGGQSTLIVSPSGQSLLIDAGFPGFHGAHPDRILAAAKKAGIKQIDYLLVTHYHRDHVGGVPELAGRIKIDTFLNHGPNREDSDITRMDYAAYEKAIGSAKQLVLKPGDGIPIKGLTVEVLTADGEHLSSPLPGAGAANPNCGQDPQPDSDDTENARSLGTLITYGKFRFIDLGDLTKKKELEMMCPNNPIGTVDLFLVSHHGLAYSNTKALVWGLHPRVAIMNNGARKGDAPEAWQTVHSSPDLQDLWQLHTSVVPGPDHNVDEKFIANPQPDADDEGFYLKVSAEPDGTFTVTNPRNQFSKTYTK
jgi:competence protein ComEC